MKQLSLVVGSTVLAATLSLTAAAQEYSNGTGALNARGRGPAILTPVEAFGVHPPGPDPAYRRKIFFRRWRFPFIPYYAPASPTASSVRWKPWCYFPLLPYYTPYYLTYCPHRLWKRKPPPYGFDGGWGPGPRPAAPLPDDPSGTPLHYGAYTSVLADDTAFWNMGGNGLVPYGTPRPPHSGQPDLVDMIQETRAARNGGCCHPSLGGVPFPAWHGAAPPPLMLPAETPEEQAGDGPYEPSQVPSEVEK